MAHSPFDHVKDATYFETSPNLDLGLGWTEHGHHGIHLPEISWLPSPTKIVGRLTQELNPDASIMGLQLTKFMVLQLIAFAIVAFVMWGLSRKVRKGEPVRGRFWNFWEAIVVFLRNEVVRPTIGDDHHDDHDHGHGDHAHGEHHAAGSPEAAADHLAHDEVAPIGNVMAVTPAVAGAHPADRYLPFVATMFLYILTCNLLGMVPWMGSPTGATGVTGALAIVTLATVVYSGIRALGPGKFVTNFCPGGVPGFLFPLIWPIEVGGLLIKHFVLAVRLFANMMAGHVVLAVFLLFIHDFAVSDSPLFYIVTPASVIGQVGISLLELFVAFLQSYIFAFLATLFIASVVHEH